MGADDTTAQTEPTSWWKSVASIGPAALPVVCIAAFIALVKSVQLAIVFAVILPAAFFLHQHWCVWRLERKLTRSRAAWLASDPATETRPVP